MLRLAVLLPPALAVQGPMVQVQPVRLLRALLRVLLRVQLRVQQAAAGRQVRRPQNYRQAR